jgi:hypothetical protein
MDAEQVIRAESLAYQQFRNQAKIYLEARYTKDVWFRAPETFENLVERWIWTIASVLPEPGGEIMSEIETQMSDLREAGLL